MAEAYVGEIRVFAGSPSRVPRGWMLCNGQSLAISGYQLLYALIGNTYGGDQQSFNLPNLVGRLAIGQGQGTGLTSRLLGQFGGEVNHTLALAETPQHTHALNATTVTAATNMPNLGVMLAKTATANDVLYTKVPAVKQLSEFSSAAVTYSGGSQPHDNVMPNMGLLYMIAVIGLFPPRPN